VISFANSYIFSGQALEIWGDSATLQRWLDVESTLARTQAELGLIPEDAARQIAACAQGANFDLKCLSDGIAVAQHPLVPVLKALVSLCGEPHGGWVHWGATTQNILDTAQALQIRATIDLLARLLDDVTTRLSALAAEHATTLQAGRTHGQHALPITFGFKVGGWLAELQRHRQRLRHLRGSACLVRMGGAVGTYAAMKGIGRKVEAGIAQHLGLSVPLVGGRSDCDPQAEYVAFLGMLAASCERIAQDVFFMQRTEVAEVEEHHYQGRAGSSTMAQKRNPQEAQRIMMLARLARSRVPVAFEAMVRQDEGDATLAHLLDFTLPEVSLFAASILQAMSGLMRTLRVRTDMMLRNLQAGGGLIMAEAVMMRLAERIGRDRAHQLVGGAATDCAGTGASFCEAVRRRAVQHGIEPAIVSDDLFDPANYLGEIPDVLSAVTVAG
jgi:3-carboxy-cis,cis-muconate cycloisomerase